MNCLKQPQSIPKKLHALAKALYFALASAVKGVIVLAIKLLSRFDDWELRLTPNCHQYFGRLLDWTFIKDRAENLRF